jgi:Tol biopolymer transport system component
MSARVLAAALVFLGCELLSAANEFDFRQITETPYGFGMFEPSITPHGGLIAFSASYDFTSQNPEQNFEIYLYDRLAAAFTQLTDSPSGYGNFSPLITPDGQFVVFRAAYDYVGENADASFELFEVTVASGEIRQLTHNPGGTGLSDPKISSDGQYVVFTSNGDPLGANPDANFEIFRIARTNTALQQLTVTPPPNLNDFGAPNGDGTRVVFRSRYDFDGTNPNANIEIWLWDAIAGISAVTITDIAQASESPAIDAAGRFVAFISRYNFTGENPTGTLEIFVKDTAAGTFAQVTTSGPLLHLGPVLAPDGTYLVFDSQRNPLGENPDTNREIFGYDIAADQLVQLTHTTGGASIPALSDRARINYAAIAADAAFFTIRNEHDLDPAHPNEGANLDLFLALAEMPGDLDCDGRLNVFDIDPFVLALTDPSGYAAAHPDCDYLRADINGDGAVNVFDIDPFVLLLTGG